MPVVALRVLLYANSANEFGPVVLLVIAVDSEVLFQSLICSFCLPSPLGWYPKVKWSFILSAVPSEWKKIGDNFSAMV